MQLITLLSFLSTSNYVSDVCDWQNPWHRCDQTLAQKTRPLSCAKTMAPLSLCEMTPKIEYFSGEGYLFLFLITAGFVFFLFLVLCVPASLLFCFFASLLFCAFPAFCFSCFSAFHASLLLCFTCFFSFLLLCFPCFPAALLFCFCASVPFYFYYSSFSFLQSCVFAALLPAPLLLCFLSLLPLCFFLFFCFILSCLYPK